MKRFKFIFSIIIVITSVILGQQIISNSMTNQTDKTDYAELNHVKYGLFNVGEWKEQINLILVDEINKLYLSRTTERELNIKIRGLLDTLIDKVDKVIRKQNSDSAGGWVKQSFINIFVDLDVIKKGIPEYSNAIIREMNKTKTRSQIKIMLNKQLEIYFKKTFADQDTTNLDRILLRTNSIDIKNARVILNDKIQYKNKIILRESILLIILSIILFSLYGFRMKPLPPSGYIFLVISLIILLVTGVTTPMIDMEARISKMSFMLMGHPVQFIDQILYFQSKSVLDVFWIMITHSDIQMKIVGLLMVTFSVVFPVLKIISSAGFYFNYRDLKKNPVIKFFVLKSGKWSMADVMVISIFMAYIGFNGIITSQFGQLSAISQELVILSTNGTSLQPGYYIFVSYTLLALFLSGFLTRKLRDAE